MTRDPIGYGDGLNVYLYVHNNPINGVDPLGLLEGEQKEHYYATLKQIEGTKLGKTKVGGRIVSGLRRLEEQNKVRYEVVNDVRKGDARGWTGGYYDSDKDEIVMHADWLKDQPKNMAPTLAHEGTHAQQSADNPEGKYVREQEDEAFIVEETVRSEQGIQMRTKRMLKSYIDLTYGPKGVPRAGEKRQPLEDFEEVENLAKEDYQSDAQKTLRERTRDEALKSVEETNKKYKGTIMKEPPSPDPEKWDE